MPQENIEKAIKRGTGELEGVNYEEVIYEGYAPGGVAVMVEATMADNRNRTTAEIRHIFPVGEGHWQKVVLFPGFLNARVLLVLKKKM